ncbi:MAG: SDR family oxidoreductase [Bacteroidota bacterium]
MKKVLVTGPDGLLGSNLVRELLARNYQVRAMVQAGRKTGTLDGLDLEIVEGDLLNPDALDAAFAGVEAVIHVAALTAVWPSRSPLHHKINVEGTENVIQAALKHGVSRMVHVGSASSFGFGPKDAPGNETSPGRSAKYQLDYIDTKLRGQEVVLEAVEEHGLPAVVVNPTFMIGAHDTGPSSGTLILAAAQGKVKAYTYGGKNWVYVKDVAVGICLALEKGRIGECYILGHENLSYREALNLIAEVVGGKKPGFGAPSFVVKAVGALGSLMSKITGKAPALSYAMAWISTDGHYFSPQKAVVELGLPQTPLKVAIAEALQWFKENGYLEK